MSATKCYVEFRRRSHFEASGLHRSRRFVTAFMMAGPFFLSLPRTWQGVGSTSTRHLNVKGIANPSFRSRWDRFCANFGAKFGPILFHFCGPIFWVQKMASIWGPPFAVVQFSFRGPQIVARKWTHFWVHFLAQILQFFAKKWPRAGHAGRQACPCLWARRPKLSFRQQGIMQFFVLGAPGVLGPRSEARIRPRFEGHFLDLVLGPRSGHKHCVTLRCASFVVQKTASFWGPRFSPQNTTKQHAFGHHGPCFCTYFLASGSKRLGHPLVLGVLQAPGHPYGGFPLIIIYWRLGPLSQGWTFRA